MTMPDRNCPDCTLDAPFTRRDFLKSTSAAVIGGAALPELLTSTARAQAKEKSPETLVKVLYDTLTEKQRGLICHEWDFVHKEMGLLRTRISNNWHINGYTINSDFYTADQKQIIKDIFENIFQPDWHKRIYKQLDDDAGGYGNHQNVAIFGKPGDGKFEFVMTGRHMTIRCDGNSTEHMAFGGPIFYGHAGDAPDNFNEEPTHPGNIYWPQAVSANKVYEMLDGKQRKQALQPKLPREQDSGFRGPDGSLPGIPVGELTADQKAQVQKTLQMLLEPYRQSDREEVLECLKKQGGLDKCCLAFYSDQDLGKDGIWDCWRLEGPSFVWYFRGSPHVHVWVNIGTDPSVKINA